MNASSESGLCATLISRRSPDTAADGALFVSDTTVIGKLQEIYFLICVATPASCYRRREHDLNHFGSDEPIQPEISRLGQRMREEVKPGQSTGEQEDFGGHTGESGARERFGAAIKNVAGQKCNQWIGNQESTCRAEQLSNPAKSRGTKDRKTYRALGQIKCERGESAATAKQQSNQQDAKVLNGQRNRRERQQRDRDACAQCDKQAPAHNQRYLLRSFQHPLLRSSQGLNCNFCHEQVSQSHEFSGRSDPRAAHLPRRQRFHRARHALSADFAAGAYRGRAPRTLRPACSRPGSETTRSFAQPIRITERGWRPCCPVGAIATGSSRFLPSVGMTKRFGFRARDYDLAFCSRTRCRIIATRLIMNWRRFLPHLVRVTTFSMLRKNSGSFSFCRSSPTKG